MTFLFHALLLLLLNFRSCFSKCIEVKRGLLESSKTLENDVLRINVKESFYVHHTNCDIKTEYFKLDISVDIPESVTIYSSKALAKKGEPYPIALEGKSMGDFIVKIEAHSESKLAGYTYFDITILRPPQAKLLSEKADFELSHSESDPSEEDQQDNFQSDQNQLEKLPVEEIQPEKLPAVEIQPEKSNSKEGFINKNLRILAEFQLSILSTVLFDVTPKILNLLWAYFPAIASVLIPIGVAYGVTLLAQHRFSLRKKPPIEENEMIPEQEEPEEKRFFFDHEVNRVDDPENFCKFRKMPLGLRVMTGDVSMEQYLEIRRRLDC